MNKVLDSFNKFLSKNRDTITGLVFFIIFMLIIYFSKDIKLLVLSSTLDARFWPRVIGIGGCIVSLVLLMQGIVGSIVTKTKKTVPAPAQNDEKKHNNDNNKVVTKETLFLVFVFILSINYIGFLPMSIVYLFFQIMILLPKEERNYLKLAVISVVFSLVVYICFRFGFGVFFPSGIIWRIFT